MQPKWHFLSSNPDLKAKANQLLQQWQQDLPFSIQSSGTTGLPQLHSFTKKQLLHSAQISIRTFELNRHTHALLCLPLTSVGGLMLLARSIVADFNLYLINPTSRPLQHLDVAIDFIALVPTQLQETLLHDCTQLKKIKRILVGGGALSQEQIRACQQAELNVWQSYGMTETLSHVALRQVSPVETPYFEALPGITFGQESGCLRIVYPALHPTPLLTTDLIELHNPTQFTWLGRADNAINSGGIKVIPEYLEAKIAPFLSVPFFVAGIQNSKWGQLVAIVFETNTRPDLSFLDKLDLSAAERPKFSACVPEFERTATQKIQRTAVLQKISNEAWKSI